MAREYIPQNTLTPANLLPTVWVKYKSTGTVALVNETDFDKATMDKAKAPADVAAAGE